MYKKDLRDYGSGNAGTTNAFRVLGWKAGSIVAVCDVGKGMAATLLLARLAGSSVIPLEVVQIIAGAAAVVGHIWSVFAGFRGGKGVATSAGVMISILPVGMLFFGAVFIMVVILTGYVSLGSIAAAAFMPFILWVLRATGLRSVPLSRFYFALAVFLLVLLTHRSNVRRLLTGEENRFTRLMVFKRARTSGDDKPRGT
jgi:glycerol-3-phosphate acyltransferase PlsY